MNVQEEEIEVTTPLPVEPQTQVAPPLTSTTSNLSKVAKARKTFNASNTSSGFGKVAQSQ